ncbi:MAG: tRNA dihydrouridine synthase DusB [Candidatus Sericytochromatia bacterium]|nr:tRNA dihydrouridine synthase DusB [Candidatus Sericytochromatia bacterium]
MQFAHLHFDHIPVVLAPMEDVTDLAFRLICKRHGADIVYTEFVSSEALIRDIRGAINKMRILDEERPIGIQIYGNKVESMVQAARIVEQAEPDLLDINYGCPSKHVAGSGAGSGLLKTPELMEAITRGVIDAVNLPVTAKTRLGWCDGQINIVEIARMLERCGIQVLTIHGRTRSQKFKGQANWELIGTAKQAVQIPIIGNGDVVSPENARTLLDVAGVDGVMIGRGAYGRPWIFKQTKHFLQHGEILPDPELAERVEVLFEHLALSIQFKGERRSALEMGKHYGNYLKGVRNVKHLKAALRSLSSYDEIHSTITRFIRQFGIEEIEAPPTLPEPLLQGV